MATAVKRLLSGSSYGRNIKIVATSTPGTLIHTAVASTLDGTYDEIYLYVFNYHTATVTVTLEWGGTMVPDDLIVVSIPAKSGLVPYIPGFPLQNALPVRAFADVANVITIGGFVNSITD